MGRMTGNEFFVKALQEEGVDKIFAYPGACVVDIFDEIYKQNDVDLILPRHEQGLIHAAEGYARSTGKPGVCLVTSGPGATNLVTGIADANLDSVPLVCFTGQVATGLIGNDTFQEVDIVGITRNITKYSMMVRDRGDLNKAIKEAFFIATSGRPGPVLVDLPKDVMAQTGSDEYPKSVNLPGYKPNTKVHDGQIKRAIKMIYKAKRPLFILGGGVKIAGAAEAMKDLMEATGIPAVTTIMGKGSVPTIHELYFGNVGMHGCYAANNAVNNCDLLISIGCWDSSYMSVTGPQIFADQPSSRTNRDSVSFANDLNQAFQDAGISSSVSYFYYHPLANGRSSEHIVDVSDATDYGEETFALLEQSEVPGVVVRQIDVNSQSDVDAYMSEEGCQKLASYYVKAIDAYFGVDNG